MALTSWLSTLSSTGNVASGDGQVKPADNAMIDAFNARLREKRLNESRFLSLEDAREKIEAWRRHYNGERSHGALRNLAPEVFAIVDRRHSSWGQHHRGWG